MRTDIEFAEGGRAEGYARIEPFKILFELRTCHYFASSVESLQLPAKLYPVEMS